LFRLIYGYIQNALLALEGIVTAVVFESLPQVQVLVLPDTQSKNTVARSFPLGSMRAPAPRPTVTPFLLLSFFSLTRVILTVSLILSAFPI
jgi:hypothetical protein